MKSQFKILILIFFCLLVAPANTKAQMLEFRSNIISMGYGFPIDNGSYSYLYDLRNIKSTGAFNLKYEHFISSNFSIGVTANFMQLTGNDDVPAFLDSLGYYKIDYNIKRTITSFRSNFLFRFNSHFKITERFDAFWGLGLGFRISTEKITDTPTGINPVYYSNYLGRPLMICADASVGLRYKCTEKIILYTELGLGQSFFQLGFAHKL